jgi:tetratricopeptide (TPR) repeat protein
MAKKPTPPRGARPSSPYQKSPVRPGATVTARPKPAARRVAGGPETTGAGRPWLSWAIVAMVITALCYLPSLSNGLVNWDDDQNITKNPNLEVINAQSIRNIFDLEKGNVIGNYNPLPILTFAIEKKLAGDTFSPRLMHTTNLLLHVATVFFVFRLLFAMGIGPLGAFIGALLFGIHPMRVESVAWVTERKDVLFAVFFFAALVTYVKWFQTEDPGRRTRLYITMLVLAALSMLAKVQAAPLGVAMLALDYWFRRPFTWKIVAEKWPFLLMGLLIGLANIYTLRTQGSINPDTIGFTMLDRLCIGMYSFCVYLYKLIIPHPMVPLYPYKRPLPTEVYAAAPVFLAFWALIYWLWKRDHRVLVFGAVFAFVNVAAVLQVLGAGQGFLADRFTYVPYFGFFAIAAYYFDRYARDDRYKTALQAVAALAFVVFAYVTVRQIGIWKNGETLWTHVIKYEGDTNSLPFGNRAQYLRDKGNYEAALRDYAKAIEINKSMAGRRNEDERTLNAETYNSRGKTYFDMAMGGKVPREQTGQYVGMALADYSAALGAPVLKPKVRAEMLSNRGAGYAATGRYPEALRDFGEALELDPTNKTVYLNRSILYFQTQQFDKVINDYTKYIELDPYNPNIWYERGMAHRILNHNTEALADLERTIQFNNRELSCLARRERARAYAQSGNKAAAQGEYQQASALGCPPEPLDQKLMGQ